MVIGLLYHSPPVWRLLLLMPSAAHRLSAEPVGDISADVRSRKVVVISNTMELPRTAALSSGQTGFVAMPRVKSTSPKPRHAAAPAVTPSARVLVSDEKKISKKTQRSLKTSERILDVAEELFSQHGLYGVTIREIAKRAAVDTALLHYYFGTKNGIFDAVLLRRSEILNKDRMEAMDVYEAAAGKKATVEGAIAAFLHPVFKWSNSGGRGWKNYCALVAQVNNTPAWGGETMAHHFDPVVQRLVAVLRRALPKARDEDLFWCYHLLSGALTLTLSETGRIDRLSKNACRSSDLEAIEPRMIAYCAAGFRKVCARS